MKEFLSVKSHSKSLMWGVNSQLEFTPESRCGSKTEYEAAEEGIT